MKILVTTAIAAAYGAALHAAAAGALELVELRADATLLDPAAINEVEVAFLSTDLMGTDRKNPTAGCLAAFTHLVDTAPRLRWIHTCSSGSDRPVLQRLLQRGVVVTTSAGANGRAVAHTAVAGLLALARDVPLWIEGRAAQQWLARRPGRAYRDLDGTRVGIVGTGVIGRSVAQMCRGLGMRTVGLRRTATPLSEFDEMGVLADLARLAPTLDWLVLCCPLTPQTRGLIDAAVLAALPDHAGLINVARGEVVDEAALFAALHAGRLLGVYSDVAVSEPPAPDSPWWSAPRVLLSAHLAGLTAEFPGRTVERFLDNLGRYAAGQALTHCATLMAPD